MHDLNEMVAGPPSSGRCYRARRPVRLDDVDTEGFLRLDGAARYLQDVAADDVLDAGVDDRAVWVVRRTTLTLERRPRYKDTVELVTWCSGVGAAWAERRTTVSAGGRPALEASALWVCLDPASRRPMSLGDWFFDAAGQAGRRRAVRGRLTHQPAPPTDPVPGLGRRPWPLRRADFDLLGHVNNTIAWVVAEEEAWRLAPERAVLAAETEYRSAVESTEDLTVVSAWDHEALRMWLQTGSGELMASGVLHLAPEAGLGSPSA